MKAVDFAASGANRARAIPAIRPITICVTKLVPFRRCNREGDEALIKTASLIFYRCGVSPLCGADHRQETGRINGVRNADQSRL
jgi:hypothetical protein